MEPIRKYKRRGYRSSASPDSRSAPPGGGEGGRSRGRGGGYMPRRLWPSLREPGRPTRGSTNARAHSPSKSGSKRMGVHSGLCWIKRKQSFHRVPRVAPCVSPGFCVCSVFVLRFVSLFGYKSMYNFGLFWKERVDKCLSHRAVFNHSLPFFRIIIYLLKRNFAPLRLMCEC